MAAAGAAGLGPGPAFLAAALRRFGEAERAVGRREHVLRVAERGVRLRFAGAALEPLVLPALGHLAAPHDAPALTVCLWDSESTGVAMLPPPFDVATVPASGEVPGWNQPRLRVMFRMGTGMLTLLDLDRRLGMIWLRVPGQWNRNELATPIRHLLAPWLEDEGLCLAHAGAVGRPGGGLLLAGPSGSGKSTTALLCLRAGLGFAGDDQVIVDPGAGRAHALYATAKVWPASLARFPELAPLFAVGAPPPDEKHVALVGRHLCPGFPLVAICLPRVGAGRASSLAPLGAAAALRGLAPSTVIQLTRDGRRTLSALARLASSVPAYALELGRDAEGVIAAVAELLERVA
jgi:hypothetical protein